MKSKTRIWTAVVAVWLALGVVDYATNGALSGEHHTADEPAAAHSTAAPNATPSAKPKTVKATVDPGKLNKLRHGGDDDGAYCLVFVSENRDGTAHLSAVLGDRQKSGSVILDVQSKTGGNWSDNHELVDAATWMNQRSPGMTQTLDLNAPVQLRDVSTVTGQLAPDSVTSDKLYDCAVTSAPNANGNR